QGKTAKPMRPTRYEARITFLLCTLLPEQSGSGLTLSVFCLRTIAGRHVRFTPESGHLQCSTPCPLWAKSGHSQVIYAVVGKLYPVGRSWLSRRCGPRGP